MIAERASLIATLLNEEVRRIVADAIEASECLDASAAASQIIKTYPNCGLQHRDVVNTIVMAAARSGVAVEFDKAARASGELFRR